MNGNANFPASAAKLATLNTDILALDASETALHTKPPTSTTAARNALIEKVKNDLRALRSDVQTAADNNTLQAEVIVKSAAMSVKAIAIHQKQKNAAKDGKVSGTIILTAEGGGMHEWQMSKDQTNIITLRATSKAKTIVPNLTIGDIWYVRNRPVLTNAQEGDWSQWIKVVVR